MRTLQFVFFFVLFIILLQGVQAGGFKDVFGKKGKEKQEDVHAHCVSKMEYDMVLRERDACRTRIKEVMEVNFELEMERDDLKIAIERLQTENTRRILRMENNLRHLELQQNEPHPLTPLLPQPYDPTRQTPPLPPLFSRNVFTVPTQVNMPGNMGSPPLQSTQRRTPQVISSESPGFQRALRANKSYNDMRKRQNAEGHHRGDQDGRPF